MKNRFVREGWSGFFVFGYFACFSPSENMGSVVGKHNTL